MAEASDYVPVPEIRRKLRDVSVSTMKMRTMANLLGLATLERMHDNG